MVNLNDRDEQVVARYTVAPRPQRVLVLEYAVRRGCTRASCEYALYVLEYYGFLAAVRYVHRTAAHSLFRR
jgi:hypothetical protein